MEKKKLIIATAISISILLTIISPLFIARADTDPTEWYKTVSGVLDTDYYSLYPFEKKSLTIGFSKFGEMIDIKTGTGLNYSGRDPFANEGVATKYWLQGWYIDIRYVHRVYGARHLWAFATFGDMVEYGGDWINGATDPYGAPHGGRKCNGYAWSDPITILYDGPRRFVALLTTHINDTIVDDSWQVIDVMFTLIFNKVKKQVIILKDIKLTIDQKILETPVNIQFSNRGEWDLGPSPNWKSFAHFYHQELDTCYDANWHLSKNITREFYYHNASFSGTELQLPEGRPPEWGFPVVWRSEYVYVNDEWQSPGIDYDINYDTGLITFAQTLSQADVKVYYKVYKLSETQPISLPHQYDLAQIISSDLTHVGYVAFWPILSDYTVDGWNRALEPLFNASEPDMLPVPSEPDIPFVIGEWDFMLDYDLETPNWGEQFRGVTVYGVTDRWNGDDAQRNGGSNTIDVEVSYQLNEIFNPWDLRNAVHKDTKCWVQFYTVTADDVYWADLGWPLYIYLDHSPVLYASTWEEYCSFSERVLWDGQLKIPLRAIRTPYDYELYVSITTGEGYIEIPATKVPAAGTKIKILYSTETTYTHAGSVDLLFEATENFNKAGVDFDFSATYSWIDKLGVNQTFAVIPSYTVLNVSSTAGWATLENFTITGDLDFCAEDFKVFKEDTAEIDCYKLGFGINPNWKHEETIDNKLKITFDYFDLSWYITPPDHEDLHIDWAHIDVDYTIFVQYNKTSGKYYTNATFSINGEGLRQNQLYDEHIPGRYEWIIVGNHSRALDSIGASLVSAAFKNKQIEIGLGGLDMPDIKWGPTLPYLLSDMGYLSWRGGPTWTDWYDSVGRLALRDDWCTTWPIASSNIISVGGPSANLVSEYFNEYTEAFQIYGIGPPKTTSNLADTTFALTCWNKNAYRVEYVSGVQTKGYAVVATYKDINGTIGFIIYGWSGQDTYYACKWLHEELIYQLQRFPLCVTSIILEIDYTTHDPTPTVVECLGTISETLVHEVKGGIHPDP